MKKGANLGRLFPYISTPKAASRLHGLFIEMDKAVGFAANLRRKRA